MGNWDRVADDQLRAFIERIERLEEERKAIAGDIAEVYAKAKGNGFDRKALKAVVRIRAMDHNERMEHEAIVELYLTALGMASVPYDHDDEASHVHVHVREDEPEHDADGVIIEPEEVGCGSFAAETTGDGLAGPANTEDARTANTKPALNSTPDSPIGEGAGEAETGETLSASPANNQAETPNETGVRNNVAEPPQANTLVPDADANPEPEPAFPPAVSVSDDRGQPAPPPSELAPVVTPDRTKPNPWCQDPEDCGVEASWNHMCGSCLRRKAEVTAAAHQEASEGRTLQ